MHLRQLDYLRLVLEKGSHAAAAQAAGVSQPAISLAMQSLERELGLALFERIGRRMVPTRAALAVAQRAADVSDKIAAMSLAPSDARAGDLAPAAASLNVGMSPAAALLYGPVVERCWRGFEPEGILGLTSGGAPDMLAALAANELDLVIAPRPRRYQVPGIRRLALHTSTPVVYCRKGHPLQAARTLADISGAAWAVTGRSSTPGNVIEEAHRVRGLAVPRILFHCPDYTTLLHLVSRTDLLCVIPHPALLAGTATATVRPMKIAEGLPQYEVSAFWKPAGARARTHHLQDIVNELRPR